LATKTLDIHPSTLQTDALHPSYRNSRYVRRREVLSLRVDGEFCGVALCEVGSRDISLFNLFNMAFVFLRTGEHAPSVAAQLALLTQVRALYTAGGEHNPLIVAPAGTLAAAQEPGTVLAETMGMILKSGRALRQYESFLNYHFGRYAAAATSSRTETMRATL
jgi:hypothetical protein